jgi:hypothetical protein
MANHTADIRLAADVLGYSDDLLERIHSVVQPGDETLTLSNKRPNVIVNRPAGA